MSQVKKLTRLGSDTRKIAALLQAKAPKGEMLAYISPQEAALLRARGGSGKPHADTGIPSYQMEDDFLGILSGDTMAEAGQPALDLAAGQNAAAYQMAGQDMALGPQGITNISQMPNEALMGGSLATSAPAPTFTPEVAAAQQAAPSPSYGINPELGAAQGREELAGLGGLTGAAPAGPSGLGKLAGALGIDKMDPTKLGIAGLQALIGGRQARSAARQGQQGKAEMQAVAAPYRAQGQQLQAQAARGELSPVGQQSLQAVQAQLAQGVQNRGGVGAAQAAAQVEAVRQQLLQSQADYGLKLSGIGDQIALGAIRAGIQADQYVNNLTSSYMGNIMRLYGGVQPAATGAKQ